MINFSLGTFWMHLTYLHYEKDMASAMVLQKGTVVPVSEADRKRIPNNLKGIFEQCARLRFEGALRVLTRTELMWGRQYTYEELEKSLERLAEEIEADLKQEFFFHYSREHAERLHRLPQEWKPIFDAFPSAKSEIEAAVDCYALGHNAACVFHISRAAEIGLRVIGRERGLRKVRGNVPLDWGTWGQIFKAIEPTIEKINQRSNGPKKDAALAFYKTVLGDLRVIQSFRDNTMHFRTNYDPGEAESAMYRTKSLMNTLATKLTETSTRTIPWSSW